VNDKSIIRAKVLKSLDATEYRVSIAAKRVIEKYRREPILHFAQLAESLHRTSSVMAVTELRR
jgi:hypothetical protein